MGVISVTRLRLRRRHQRQTATAAMKTAPPTAPPTAGPTVEWFAVLSESELLDVGIGRFGGRAAGLY